MGFLSSLFGGDAGKATKKAARKNEALARQFRETGTNIVNDVSQSVRSDLGDARGLYADLTDRGDAALSLYESALGIGDPSAARSAFEVSPGYEFAMDQGMQALLRAQSAGGQLNSGNTSIAAMQYGQGLANQEYNQYLDRLAGMTGMYERGIGGQANTLGALANEAISTGNQRLGIESGSLSSLMSANNQYAAGQEASVASRGGALSGLLGAVGTIGGAIVGGPTGAAIGGRLGYGL